MIADKTATDKLTSPTFFMVGKGASAGTLVNLCLSLKNLLEPEKQWYPADVNGRINDAPTVLHNAVSCISEFKAYNLHASKALCVHMLGQQAADQLMADKKARGLIPENYQGIDLSFGELIVAYLCQQHADVNAMDTTGRTPIFYAESPEIIYLLRRNGALLTIKGRAVAAHLHRKRQDETTSCSVVYDHARKRNIKAIEALMEYIPGYSNLDNLNPGVLFESADGERFYHEGKYVVWLAESDRRPRVANIQNVERPSQQPLGADNERKLNLRRFTDLTGKSVREVNFEVYGKAKEQKNGY